jgi:hypothetical protein
MHIIFFQASNPSNAHVDLGLNKYSIYPVLYVLYVKKSLTQ